MTNIKSGLRITFPPSLYTRQLTFIPKMGIAGTPSVSTVEVFMNDQKRIEVKQNDPAKKIRTSGLGGCLAIGVIIEDQTGTRRCGLAHYDPMTLRSQLEKEGNIPGIIHLFNSTAQTDKDRLAKASVIIMSVDTSGHQMPFIDNISLEAHCLLNCKTPNIVEYGELPADSLEIYLPNNQSGPPLYWTETIDGKINW